MPEIKRTSVSEAEEIELEYKRLQVEQMREQLQDRKNRTDRIREMRENAARDMRKAQQEREHRQRVCKHRKGGRDNRFANGNDQNYSVVTNTYPTGQIAVMCTRCGKEVWKPEIALKKTDPAKYKAMMEEFRTWVNYPTDNTPSGSKVFEIVAAQ